MAFCLLFTGLRKGIYLRTPFPLSIQYHVKLRKINTISNIYEKIHRGKTVGIGYNNLISIAPKPKDGQIFVGVSQSVLTVAAKSS